MEKKLNKNRKSDFMTRLQKAQEEQMKKRNAEKDE